MPFLASNTPAGRASSGPRRATWLLALLAVFTAEAAGATGMQFAVVYALFLLLMGWAWYSVRELDRVERPEFLRITAFYVGGMIVSTLVVGATAALKC